MFSFRIINSARFLQMPQEAQNLYFHLGLRADDDGVAEAYPVMKLLGTANDNLRILVEKGFLELLNNDLVVFVIDWLEHNNIRSDRKVDSIYKSLLNSKKIKTLSPTSRSDVKDNSKRLNKLSTVSPRSVQGQHRLVEVRLDKVSNIRSSKMTKSDFDAFWNSYPKKVGKKKSQQRFMKLQQDILPDLLKSLEEQKKSEQWQKKQYIPHPLTWLNGARWEDEISEMSEEEIAKKYNEKYPDYGYFRFEKDYGEEVAEKYAHIFDV